MRIPALPSDPTNPGGRTSAARIALLVVLGLLVAAGAFLVARQDGVSTALSFTDSVSGSGVPATQARTASATT
jgi:hypothetical protein